MPATVDCKKYVQPRTPSHNTDSGVGLLCDFFVGGYTMQWWNDLEPDMQRVLIFAGVGLAFLVLVSFVFFGADFGGFGDWLQSWFK
jgi:hypothetical protein